MHVARTVGTAKGVLIRQYTLGLTAQGTGNPARDAAPSATPELAQLMDGMRDRVKDRRLAMTQIERARQTPDVLTNRLGGLMD